MNEQQPIQWSHWRTAIHWALILLPFAIFLHGYKYSYSDHWLWIPVAKQVANPELYPHDYLVNHAPDPRFTLLPAVTGWLGELIGFSWSFFVVYLVGQFLLNLGFIVIGRALGGGLGVGLALAIVMMRMKDMPASVYPLVDNYLVPKFLATGFWAVALAGALYSQFRVAAPIGAMGTLFQPLVLGPFVPWLIYEWFREFLGTPKRRWALFGAAVAALAVVAFKPLLATHNSSDSDLHILLGADPELIRRAFELHWRVTNPWMWEPTDVAGYLLLGTILVAIFPKVLPQLKAPLTRYLGLSALLLVVGLIVLRFAPVNFFLYAQPSRFSLHLYVLGIALCVVAAMRNLAAGQAFPQWRGALMIGVLLALGKRGPVPMLPIWALLVLWEAWCDHRQGGATRGWQVITAAGGLVVYGISLALSERALVLEGTAVSSMLLALTVSAITFGIARIARFNPSTRLATGLGYGMAALFVGLFVVVTLGQGRLAAKFVERVNVPWRQTQGPAWELQRWLNHHTPTNAVIAIEYTRDVDNLLRLDSERSVFWVDQDSHGLYVYYELAVSDELLRRDKAIGAKPWLDRAQMQEFLREWPQVQYLVLPKTSAHGLDLPPTYTNDEYQVLDLSGLGTGPIGQSGSVPPP